MPLITSVADSICIKSLSTIREAIASTILDHPELKGELIAIAPKFLANVVAGQTTVASYPNANSFFNLLSDNSFITYLDFNNDAAVDANDETVLGQIIP